MQPGDLAMHVHHDPISGPEQAGLHVWSIPAWGRALTRGCRHVALSVKIRMVPLRTVAERSRRRAPDERDPGTGLAGGRRWPRTAHGTDDHDVDVIARHVDDPVDQAHVRDDQPGVRRASGLMRWRGRSPER